MPDKVAPAANGGDGALDDPAAAAADSESLALVADADVARFRAAQFSAQLLPQLLFPASVPFIALLVSRAAALNALGLPRPLRPRDAPAPLLFAVMSAAPLVTVAAWCAAPAGADAALAATLVADVVHVVAAFACMRLAICVKYAYMLPRVYAARRREWAPSAERAEEQLISGWRIVSAATIAREVAASAAACAGAADAEVELRAGALPRVRAALACDAAAAIVDRALRGGGARLPVPALAEALQTAAQARTLGFAAASFYALLLFGVVGTLASTAMRLALGEPALGRHAAHAVVIVGHYVANCVLMATTFNFLAIGANDHLRRAHSLALLGRLFSRPAAAAAAPLSFDSVAQVRAFLAARELLLDFGAVFHERLVLVTSAFLVIFLLLSAYCLLRFFAATGGTLAPLVSTFLIAHVLVQPAFLCIFAGLAAAARANDAAAAHAAVVAAARLDARLAAGADAARGAPVADALGDLERAVLARQSAAPIAVLGVPATFALAQSFAGFIASFETVALTLFLAKGVA